MTVCSQLIFVKLTKLIYRVSLISFAQTWQLLFENWLLILQVIKNFFVLELCFILIYRLLRVRLHLKILILEVN